MSRKSWIQIEGKLIPKEDFHGSNARAQADYTILPDIEPFKSPVDGRIVNSRSALRRHNKELDVTNYADFSPDYVRKRVEERQQRSLGQTKQDRQERIELLKNAIDNQRR